MIRIEHANFTVQDLDDAIELFQVLWPEAGVRCRATTEGMNGEFEWVHFGDDDTYVALQESPQKVDFYPSPHVKDFYSHLGFEVTDLAAIVAQLESMGYVPVMQADVEARKRAYFLDRSGNYFELVEYLSDDPALRNQYV